MMMRTVHVTSELEYDIRTELTKEHDASLVDRAIGSDYWRGYNAALLWVLKRADVLEPYVPTTVEEPQ